MKITVIQPRFPISVSLATYNNGVTVIITAYNRSEYLQKALKSVIEQEHEGFGVEIIVLTNFNNGVIESLCYEAGIKYVTLPDKGMGFYLSYGISISKYDIISFLDDDDIFLPGKLKRVYEQFTFNKDLAYYHNRFHSMDSQPNFSGGLRKIDPEVRIGRRISFMMRYGNWENLSSVSIRKSRFVKHINSLGILTTAPDLFFVMTSIDKKLTAIIDSMVLTDYTVHESDSHIVKNDQLYTRKAKLLSRYIDSISLILSTLTSRHTISFMRASLSHTLYLNMSLNKQRSVMKTSRLLSYSLSGLLYSRKQGIVDLIQILLLRIFPDYMNHRTLNYISENALPAVK